MHVVRRGWGRGSLRINHGRVPQDTGTGAGNQPETKNIADPSRGCGAREPARRNSDCAGLLIAMRHVWRRRHQTRHPFGLDMGTDLEAAEVKDTMQASIVLIPRTSVMTR